MIIREGSPEEIYQWFVVERTTELILCIFLCRNTKQIDVLEESVQRAFEIDTIIGEKIGFLFLGDGVGNLVEFDRGKGKYVLLPGNSRSKMDSNTDSIPVRSFVGNFDLDRWRKSEYRADQDHFKSASRILAEASSRVVPEFCTYFDIDPSSLPGILLLYKGFEEVQYFEIGGGVDAEQLILFFRKLVEISDSVERDLIGKKLYIHEMYEILGKHKDSSIELEAKKQKIEKAVYGLCRKHDFEDVDCQRIIGAFTSISIPAKVRDELVSEIKILHPHSLNDGRWNKAERLSNRLREMQEEIADLVSPRKPIDIMDRIAEEKYKIERIRDKMAGLQNEWGRRVSRSNRLSSDNSRFYRTGWKSAERVNTAWDLAEKAKKVVAIISGLVAGA